jgi:outer membrane protein assembly factor BamD (BamD/ComL family)
VNVWPFSDYAPQARYLVGRAHEARFQDEAAFKAYQKLIERYPKVSNYDEVVLRQMAIASRYLAGQWFKAFSYLPIGPSMEKTIKMYDQIIKNGPYSEVAPQAQINIGVAHEKKFVKDFPEAARAYERAADRYADRQEGTDALFMVGDTHFKEAKKAEYDQSVAGQAIANFMDFATLHPEDVRASEAQGKITALRTEQARGARNRSLLRTKAKMGRRSDLLQRSIAEGSTSKYAEQARRRIDEIKREHAK